MKKSSRRGECILISLGCLGCLFVMVAGGIFALWLYLRPKPSDVRPIEHQTPARTIEISSRTSTPSPVKLTPAPVEIPPVAVTPKTTPAPLLSAENLSLGMTHDQVKQLHPTPKARLTYADQVVTEILEAHQLKVGTRQWSAGQTADLKELRLALPTRRESQRSERDGSVCHAFPLNGVEVRVWLKEGRYQKFALLSATF